MLFSLLFRLFWFKDIFVDKTDDKISNKTQCLGSVTDGFIKHNKMGSKSDWPQQLECEEILVRCIAELSMETSQRRSDILSRNTQKSVVRTLVSASMVVMEGSSLTLRSMSTMLVEMASAVAVSWEHHEVVDSCQYCQDHQLVLCKDLIGIIFCWLIQPRQDNLSLIVNTGRFMIHLPFALLPQRPDK